MPEDRLQAVTGVVSFQDEARIRLAWPSVQRFTAVASLGRALTRSIVLAPLAWLLMAPFYFLKLAPFLMTRYLITNQRVRILRGWSGKTVAEARLAEVADVKVEPDSNSSFFRAATIRLLDQTGKDLLVLGGVPDPEPFRIAVINACNAWVPGKKIALHFRPASAK